MSADPNFLEACVRFYPNDPSGASEPVYLSSGTEDFFLSASYFDQARPLSPPLWRSSCAMRGWCAWGKIRGTGGGQGLAWGALCCEGLFIFGCCGFQSLLTQGCGAVRSSARYWFFKRGRRGDVGPCGRLP